MMIMRKSYRLALVVLILLGLVSAAREVGHSQSEGLEIFPTRHSVEGAFLDFYRAVPNPELVYGYPITGAFTREDGLRVQYFQRARFELGPDGVVLTPIGTTLYQPGRRLSDFNDRAGSCRIFDTGFRVCSDFLDFFETHGGAGQFGRPISLVEEDGVRQVQYFEYARLEWHPESLEPGLAVRLGELGRLYFDSVGEDQGLLTADRSSGIIQITQLRLHAFPATTAVRGDASQQVFIIVQDQTYAPVADLEVSITVRYPDGRLETYPAVTNEHGFIELSVPLDPDLFGAGRVYVSAAAGFSELEKPAQTSFWSTR
jgi:hypothetical protein